MLVSHNTLRGQEPKPEFRGQYPRIDEIYRIPFKHPQALWFIHYNTKDTETLRLQLVYILEVTSPLISGFQLNIPWPSPVELEKFRMQYPDKKLVLQIGRQAYRETDESPKLMANRVAGEYTGLTDYVLIDPSGGEGRRFDIEMARECLAELQDRQTGMQLVVAGGLCAANLEEQICSLLVDFPDLSVDAQGQLMDKLTGRLDLTKAGAYVSLADEIFRTVRTD